MSANNSSDSINDFDGPFNINDPIDTAVGRRVSDSFASWVDGIHEVAPCAASDADDAATAADELLLQTERGRAALDRLARVHPLQHAAVLACVVEGLSVRTAAKTRFGVSHKAVHMRKHLGLEKLRVWCYDEEKAPGDVA